MRFSIVLLTLLSAAAGVSVAAPGVSDAQLAKWLKQFPKADANGDGRLTAEEALAFRAKMQGRGGRGAKRTFEADPGWQKERFPQHAMCYRTPEELKAIFPNVVSFEKPTDGALRIVGTGHSFMIPGFKTFPAIARAAGFANQPLHTHTGGGMTGSARYKWEQENGIFGFEGKKPQPKLLASIANAEWDAMIWGPYFMDRPEYYSCWIDYCLQHHPHMKFYLSDAWPSIQQLDKAPTSEDELTHELFVRLEKQKNADYQSLLTVLEKSIRAKSSSSPPPQRWCWR